MMYIIYGLDAFLINKSMKNILPDDELAIEYFDLENSSIEAIIKSCDSLSLFGDKKYIVVENSYIFTPTINKKLPEQNIEMLEKYINNINENVVLVFKINKEKLDERKKIVKQVKEKGKIIECNKSNDVTKTVKDFFDSYDIRDENIKLLINRVGENLAILEKEAEKLKLYKLDEKTITKDDIELLCYKNVDLDIFKLVENIVLKNKEKAIESYHELIKNGEEPIKLIIILANQFRMIYQTKKLYSKGYSEANIAQKLKVHPYAIKKAYEKTREFNEKDLLKLLYNLALLDKNIKLGNVEGSMGLELFILNI